MTIYVHTLPKITAKQDGGSALMIWAGDCFDYVTPFRDYLAQIVAMLAEHAPAEQRLPEYQEWEDFVEGEFSFGPNLIHIYYEHSLGYLELSAPDRMVLDRVLAVTGEIFEVLVGPLRLFHMQGRNSYTVPWAPR